MKAPRNRNQVLKTSGISVGLATFLVVGLSGCDGSNDSLATKQQKCKLQEYRIQHQDECQYIKNEYGNTSVNNSHNSGSSWVPMWMMLHSMNNNAHSGYSYSSDSGSKSSGFFSSSSSHGSGSSSSGG